MSEKNMIKLKSYVINTNLEIGRGQYGVVYQCQDTNNPQLKLCAKVINERLDDPKTKREIELMGTIMKEAKGNKNIVGVEYVDFDDERIVLILERCECDLQSLIDKRKRQEQKNFHPDEALNILKQIVNGYKVLYFNNIIHRDLKPANILVLDGFYKISDLGLARQMENGGVLTKVGTPKYVAPQLYLENFFSNSADIFSLGIITYELIFGGLPYVANSQLQVKKSLRNLEKVPVVVKQDHPGMTQAFALLIESMLKFKEQDRISWLDLMEHPLISEGKAVVNQSGFIKDNPNEEDEEDEEPVQEQQKPAESPVNEQQQQVPLKTVNPPIPTFTAPVQFPQMAKPMNTIPTLPQQFQPQKFSTPQNFVPSAINQQKPNPFPNPRFQSVTNPPQAVPQAVPQPVSNAAPSFPNVPFNAPNAPVNNVGQPFQFQQVQAQSDQLYQTGVVVDQALDSLERFINMQLSLKQEWYGLKLYLHYYSQCFFEHAKALKAQGQNPPQQQFYTLANVEQAIEKQQRYHQVISQELDRHQLNTIYPVMPINPDFNSYLQKLKQILQNKGLFQYSPDKKYYVEYLQLLYFFERLKDQKEPFEDVYSTASDTFKNQKAESVLVDYLNKRFTL
ncbi:unnamed protein product (macronuclear) [Paramecium tetraurelia]|uniref:Protein kinase domain-containing protein n=1 Tax=Paramecium tetraurelia TaxID=5888 RepID=A0C6J1_PARTE|nr:uncharacterized protein GSPATT00035537001 [Paramecium tetraurelia]CAK66408.1 unnamed protein product [Paramecium tetraurelia]|eukprot:XP_001433805.1 hypothetical protein (macronuclear) [Paramecium tetraurelia strain d4-2]